MPILSVTDETPYEATLRTALPEGRVQIDIVNESRAEIDAISDRLMGKHVRINGRITTGMALMLGHKLAHICKTVSVFDPKESDYVLCVYH